MDKIQIRYFMLSMVLSSIMGSAVSPYLMTTLLKEYGFSNYLLSLIPVICQAGALFSLPVSLALSKYDSKHVALSLFAGSRLALLVFVAALALPHQTRGGAGLIIFAAYAAMHLVSASASGVCNAWFKRIILDRMLGSLLGKRNALHFIIVGILTPVIGWSVEKHSLLGVDKNTVFLCLMLLAVVAGFLDIKVLTKINLAGNLAGGRAPAVRADLKKAAHDRCLWRAVGVAVMGNLGTLVLTPYSILLFYELGLRPGMVAAINGVSMISLAMGQIAGGHLADRVPLRKTFLWSVMAAMVGTLALLCVSIGIFSFKLDRRIAGGILLSLPLVSSTAAGVLLSVNTKYMFNAVEDNFAVSFAFMDLARGLMVFGISLAVAKIGAALSGGTSLAAAYLWPGCHYLQFILIMSLAGYAAGMRFLRRHLPAAR